MRGREGSDGAAAKNEGEGRIQLELKKLPGQGRAGGKELEGGDRGGIEEIQGKVIRESS